MTSFEILLTEPSYLDFTVDYNQSITNEIFDNIFDVNVIDKKSSDLFLDGLCLFINTHIPLRHKLREKVLEKDGESTPYKLELNNEDKIDIKTALYNTSNVLNEWELDKYINFVFTSTPVINQIKFCIKVKMQ